MKIGDLVTWRNDGRLGIVMSEVFDMRPKWKDEHPAVHVQTRHALAPDEEGLYIWLLEDIVVLNENR